MPPYLVNDLATRTDLAMYYDAVTRNRLETIALTTGLGLIEAFQIDDINGNNVPELKHTCWINPCAMTPSHKTMPNRWKAGVWI